MERAPLAFEDVAQLRGRAPAHRLARGLPAAGRPRLARGGSRLAQQPPRRPPPAAAPGPPPRLARSRPSFASHA